MAEETQRRKADHIRICLNEKAQAKKTTSGFEDVHFVHKALPEVDKNKIDLSTYFLGHKFNAPLMVGAMTGGTPQAEKINANIAQAVEKLGLGMGVGSQRAAVENVQLTKTFAVARKKAPTAFIVANLGGVQLVHGYGLNEIKKSIEMVDADAVAIHLNALQEAVQPEGQTNFEGVLEKISEIADKLDKPVIVKETGSGIAAEETKQLEAAGVKALDVGGAGGTSFAAVEYYRTIKSETDTQSLGETFWDWGIPTVVSIVEIAQTSKIPVIGSGGIRNGTDMAKAIALGSTLTSVTQPILQAAVESTEATQRLLSVLMEELKTTMFLVGSKSVQQLAKAPVVVMGNTSKWLELRGFNIKEYANRGAR
ncbi:MAG: type 2 isopentenyl-diphosphate Delta-isomerase [Candidatus Bathyarchaeota archaeon]|nr:type 2 isopentenyl-diphosphate Delta-isomerase [Candidatus Bathyarchaeota archaeon]